MARKPTAKNVVRALAEMPEEDFMKIPFEVRMQAVRDELRDLKRERCARCFALCRDENDQWWHGDEHYCQTCYQKVTSG